MKVRVRPYVRRKPYPRRIREVSGVQWQRFDVPPGSEQEFLVIEGDPPIRLEVSPFADEGWYYAIYEQPDREILYESMTVGEPVQEGVVSSKAEAQAIALRYSVRVRPYVRRKPYLRARPLSREGLGAAIDDVVSGKASGYTWTRDFKFNIDEPEVMERVYDKLYNRTLYAVATTNLTLAEREAAPVGPSGFAPVVGRNEGISLWRRADGTVFMDNIVLFFGPKVSEDFVLKYAKEQNQQVIIKVDGRTRSWKFVDVPGWKVIVKGTGAERTFEPVVT